MLSVVFWILYTFGGAVFILLVYIANSQDKKNRMSFWSYLSVGDSLKLILLGEVIWIILWCIGFVIDPTKISFWVGCLPLLMPAITFSSIFLLKLSDIRSDGSTKVKETIKIKVRDWKMMLPINIKNSYIYLAIDEHRDMITGRIVIEFKTKKEFDNIDWEKYGDILKNSIGGAIILQIKLNGELVYP